MYVLKDFNELTISDDFMFCKVMENKALCKEFIEMTLAGTIGSIKTIEPQHTMSLTTTAKSVRFDVLVQDEADRFYDIEMQVCNEYNIAKRMRYYQAALDMSMLDKGVSYNHLTDSIIVFVCLFDAIGSRLPVYTFENICREDRTLKLQDGSKKIILNAADFTQAQDERLRGFLEYIKTGKSTTDFTRRIERMVQAVRTNEQARQEYQWVSGHIMDARDSGFAQGLSQGLSQGAYQANQQTAKLMKQHKYPCDEILMITGLSQTEIELL